MELGAVHRISDGDPATRTSCHRIPGDPPANRKTAGRLGGGEHAMLVEVMLRTCGEYLTVSRREETA